MSTAAAFVHGVVEQILYQKMDIFLPQPCSVKQDAVELFCSCADLVLLMPEDQKTQPLQGKIFPEVGMADRVRFVLFQDLLPVVQLVCRSGIRNQPYFLFYTEQQTVSIGFFLDKFYGMTHQFHQTVVIRKLTLAVGDISNKRCVFSDMSCHIQGAFWFSVVVAVPDVFFVQTLPHGGPKVIGKQKQQKLEQLVVRIDIGCQIYDVWKIQNFVQKILEKVIFLLSAEAGPDDQPLVAISKKPHHIAGAIGIIDGLEDHLLLRQVCCILCGFRKQKDPFPFQLHKGFVGKFTCQIRNRSKSVFFLLGVIPDSDQFHCRHLGQAYDSRMPLQTDS